MLSSKQPPQTRKAKDKIFIKGHTWQTHVEAEKSKVTRKLGKYLYYFLNVPILSVRTMIAAVSQLHKLQKNDFPPSLQKSLLPASPIQTGIHYGWNGAGRRHELQLSGQPEAFPAHVKPRLSPKDLQPLCGRLSLCTSVAHQDRPLSQRPDVTECLQCGTCGWQATIKAASWERDQEAGL